MAVSAEEAAFLNPNKLNGSQVLERLKAIGLSELDAGLVTDCVNVHKAVMWQNTDEVSDAQVAAARKFLDDNRLGVSVEVSPGRFGKFIWETKLVRYSVQKSAVSS